MGVGLHGRDHAGMSQPLLHKLPVYWFPILQVGTDEGRCMRMPQDMRMQQHSRFLRVVLKHVLNGCKTEGCSISALPISVPGALVEHDPEVIGARVRFDPDFGE